MKLKKVDIIAGLVSLGLVICMVYFVILPKVRVWQFSLVSEGIVEINSLGLMNEKAQGNEVIIKRVVIDGKNYSPQKLLKEGNWNFEEEYLRWKSYDNKIPITNSIKLLLPSGHKKSIVFDKGLYRGIVEVKFGNDEKKVDLFSFTQDELILNYNGLKRYDNFVKFIFIIIAATILFLLIFMFLKYKYKYFLGNIEYLLFGIEALLITRTFTTSPWSNIVPFSDSAAFIYIGKAMQNGSIPYQEIVDNKGIVFYAYQNLAQWLFGGWTGIWITETVCLFLFFLYSNKTIELIVKNKWEALFIGSTVLPFMPQYFMQGNFVEILVLPLLSIVQYHFSYIILQEDKKREEHFIWGLFGFLGAIVLFVKINLTISWIVVGVGYVLYYYKRDKARLFQMIIRVIIGISIVCVPIIFYLYKNNLVQVFYEMTITHNKGMLADKFSFRNVFEYYKNNLYFLGVLLSAIILIVELFKNINLLKKRLVRVHLFYAVTIYMGFAFTLLLVSLGKKMWDHYFVVLFPYVVICYGLAYTVVKGWFSKHKKEQFGLGLGLGLWISLIVIWQHSLYPAQIWPEKIIESSEDMYVSYLIKNHSNIDDGIMVSGFKPKLYLMSNRFSASKFFYYAKIGNWFSYEPYYKELVINKPKVFVNTLPDFLVEDDSNQIKQLLENEYYNIYSLSANSVDIYVRRSGKDK